jgi:hypothetical protein
MVCNAKFKGKPWVYALNGPKLHGKLEEERKQPTGRDIAEHVWQVKCVWEWAHIS